MSGSDSIVIYLFTASAIITLVLVAVIILFIIIYRRRVVHQQVEVEKIKLRLKTESLNATVEGQEAERKRISSELHDSVGALLSSLRLQLRHHQRTHPTGNEFTDDATQLIDETIDTVRQISHNLMPPVLEKFGFAAAIRHLVSHIHKTGTLQVDADVEMDEVHLSKKAELSLYRICQELLNNTLKHSEASRAVVELSSTATQVVLSYRDNGKGFTPTQGEHKGLGLRNIEARINHLEGTFEWDTESGKLVAWFDRNHVTQ